MTKKRETIRFFSHDTDGDTVVETLEHLRREKYTVLDVSEMSTGVFIHAFDDPEMPEPPQDRFRFFHHGLEQEMLDWIHSEKHDHFFIHEWNGGYIVNLVQEAESAAEEEEWHEAPWVIQHAVPIQLFLLLTTLLFAALWVNNL